MATMQMSVRPEDLSQVPQGSERIPEPGILVIFGASGDLTKRKLLPALFHLEQAKLLPEKFAIVGAARRALGDEFAADMRTGIVEHGSVEASDPKLDNFVKKISYFPLNFDDPADYAGLKVELDRIDKEQNIGGGRLFYLATAPEFFAGIIQNLGAQGMAQPEPGQGCDCDRKAIRPRSGVSPRAESPGECRIPRGAGFPHRSLTSAKRRFRIFWCSALPTEFSSRYGNAIT